MEQSSFQRKLIRSARDAAAIKVHSKEDPPDFRMRSTKVFSWDKRTSQTKAIFQVIIADGCLFYGNYALRSRGGCCICLLMASGLTAKRFSMWVADAEEGELYYTLSSKRNKVTVFIILPRIVYTTWRHCVSQSEMDDSRSGGQGNITKTFLLYAVTLLSRIYVGKTRGQEVFWKQRPPNWKKHLSWKNPTSPPKDSTEILMEKYYYLRSLVPHEKLSQEQQNAFQDFEAGNLDNVESFMLFNKWEHLINDMINKSPGLQQPYKMLIYTRVKMLYDIVSSPVASTSGCPTAAETSSSTLSKKRKPVSQSVQSKKCKTEIPSCGDNIQNNSRKIKGILPKPTQTTSSEFSTVFPQGTVLSQSSAVENPVRYTFPNQPQQSLVSSNNTISNTCIDISKFTTPSDHPETASATNVLPPVVIIHTHNNPLLGSHEELSKAVSLSIPITSLDSGTWSQESNISKEACDIKLGRQNLNDKNVQDDLQFICNKTDQNNDFDPSIFMNFDT